MTFSPKETPLIVVPMWFDYKVLLPPRVLCFNLPWEAPQVVGTPSVTTPEGLKGAFCNICLHHIRGLGTPPGFFTRTHLFWAPHLETPNSRTFPKRFSPHQCAVKPLV